MIEDSDRRLVQSALVTINGIISSPATWAGPYFGPDTAAHSLAALENCDAFLMGRGTYEVFSAQWPGAGGDYADRLNAMPKYVFSSTLKNAEWNNTTIVSTDVVTTVAAMKRERGRDLIFYGHGRFGQSMIDAGLVDELTITVVPVFHDSGTPFFRPGLAQTWELAGAGPGRDPGLASLTYRPAPDSRHPPR